MTATSTSRHLTASAVVFDPARGLVLVIDHRASGQRQFPGGHVDADQTPAEAAIREVREECGVDATLWTGPQVDLPGAVWHPSPFMTAEFPAPAKPANGAPAHHHIDELFLATADSATPLVPQLNEVAAATWLPVDRITEYAVRAEVPLVTQLAWAHLTGSTTYAA